MTTTTWRQTPALWVLALAGTIIAGAPMFAVTTIDTNQTTTPAPAAPVTAPVFPEQVLERAERVHAAQRELVALRSAVNVTPSIGESMRYRMTLLTLVSSRHIPVEALEPTR